MALIFIASADPESGPRGSRLLAPLLRWLMPDITADALEQVVLVVRKFIHFATFGVLAALVWRALAAAHPGRWYWRTAGLALAITAAYAASDEWHQTFVPTRVGSALDVLIDTAGAAFVLGCIHRFGRLRRRW